MADHLDIPTKMEEIAETVSSTVRHLLLKAEKPHKLSGDIATIDWDNIRTDQLALSGRHWVYVDFTIDFRVNFNAVPETLKIFHELLLLLQQDDSIFNLGCNKNNKNEIKILGTFRMAGMMNGNAG